MEPHRSCWTCGRVPGTVVEGVGPTTAPHSAQVSCDHGTHSKAWSQTKGDQSKRRWQDGPQPKLPVVVATTHWDYSQDDDMYNTRTALL